MTTQEKTLFESAVLGHFIGDFMLQSDYVAANKKTSTTVCISHCLMWTLAVIVMGNIWHPAAIAWLFLTHFAIDRTGFINWWMTGNDQSVFRDKLGPWSSILVDNLFHVLSIWVVFHFGDTTAYMRELTALLIVVFLFAYAGFTIDTIRKHRGETTSTKVAEENAEMPESPVQGRSQGEAGASDDPAAHPGLTQPPV